MIQGEETPQRHQGAGLRVHNDAPTLRGGSKRRTRLGRMRVPLCARLLALSGFSSPGCTASDSRSDVAFHRRSGFPTGLVYGDGGAAPRSKRLSRISSQEEMLFILWLATGKRLLLSFVATQAWMCRR